MNIKIKVKNLIKNPCKKFLSYLYESRGWKRVIFDTSKECYIDSYIGEEKIRIVVVNNCDILIYGHCMFDIVLAMEHLIKEFKYGRIYGYLSDKNIEIIKEFGYEIDLGKYGYNNFDEQISVPEGSIRLENDRAIINFSQYENGKILNEAVMDVFAPKKIEEEENLAPELLVFASLFGWTVIKFIGNLF